MKVFLSWSGSASRSVAQALFSWLPRVIQAIDPFISGEIEKGAKWSNEIDSALEGTTFGIICLTKDNLRSPWILYEAGALSKTTDAYVWTFLLDLSPSDVEPPLSKFQHTVAEKDDVRRLLHTINRRLAAAGERALSEAVLDDIFATFWPQLEEALGLARSTLTQSTVGELRTDRELLEEVLELVRAQRLASRLIHSDFRLRDPQGEGLPIRTRSELQRYLEYLGERDAKVMLLLYGDGERLPMHIDDVAEILGISRERVRQHHNRAVHQIRDVIISNSREGESPTLP